MNQTAAAPMSAPTVLVPKKKHRNLAQGVVEAFTNSI